LPSTGGTRATGGAPATGGGGGGGGQCVDTSCPSCLISGILGVACCKSDGTCGCRAILGIFPCG
jgi:hypothetical protein